MHRTPTTTHTAALPAALFLAVSLVLPAAGCSGLDLPPMGEAHRFQAASQTLNPEAGGDAPVLGLPGPVAERAMRDMINGENRAEAPMATQMAPR